MLRVFLEEIDYPLVLNVFSDAEITRIWMGKYRIQCLQEEREIVGSSLAIRRKIILYF
jgi:hypothetical protein